MNTVKISKLGHTIQTASRVVLQSWVSWCHNWVCPQIRHPIPFHVWSSCFRDGWFMLVLKVICPIYPNGWFHLMVLAPKFFDCQSPIWNCWLFFELIYPILSLLEHMKHKNWRWIHTYESSDWLDEQLMNPNDLIWTELAVLFWPCHITMFLDKL